MVSKITSRKRTKRTPAISRNAAPNDNTVLLEPWRSFATHAEDSHARSVFAAQRAKHVVVQRRRDPRAPANATKNRSNRLPDFVGNEKNEGRNVGHWRFDTPEKYQRMMKRIIIDSRPKSTRRRTAFWEHLEAQGVPKHARHLTTDNGTTRRTMDSPDKWYPHQESIRVSPASFAIHECRAGPARKTNERLHP